VARPVCGPSPRSRLAVHGRLHGARTRSGRVTIARRRLPRQSTMRTLVAAAFASTLPLVCVPSQAIIAQASGLPSPAQVIDFGANVLPNFTPVSTEFAGLTITHASYFTTGVSNNLVGGFLTNNFSAGQPNTLRIQFAAPITDCSFVYHQIGQQIPSQFRAMLQGVTMDSFSILWNQTQSNNYFGFTNTALDELQIDFDSDFNLDTLAISPALPGGACLSFNGSNVNPVAYSCATLPVLGTTWQGTITTTPNTVLTALVFAPAGVLSAPVPLFGGELLVDPSASLIAFTSAGSYSLAIPTGPSWVGVTLASQGVRLEQVGPTLGFVPLNGQQLILGQ
jgi:hypothetical protein